MPVSTIETAFVILDRGTPTVRKLRRELRGLQHDAEKAGLAMDGVADKNVVADMDRLAATTRSVRSEVRGIPGDVRPGERALGDLDRRVQSVDRSARRAGGSIGGLSTKTKLLGVAAGVALPAVESLAGGVTALAGSLMGAGLGAGAVGLAGGGTLVAGLGSLIAVGKPAATALKNVTKEQDAYTKAVQDYGKHSREAINAKRTLDATYANNPGIQRATREMKALNKEWKELTAPGRQQLLGLLGDASQIGRRAAPRMARNANAASGAARRSGDSQLRFLAGNFSQDTLEAFTKEFVRDLPIAERTLENMEVTVGRIAKASLPFFHEGVVWAQSTSMGWRESSKDAAKLHHEIGGYVDDLKDWGHLTHSAFELAKDVLMGGRPAGRSMVEDLTKTLDKWDSWVDRNPEKIDLFFRNAADDTESMASGVVSIVHGLHDLSQELRPLLAPLERFAALAGTLSGAVSPGVASSLFLGLRAGKNRIAAGGAAGGAAVAGGGGGMGGLPLIFGGGARASAGARLATRTAAGQELAFQRIYGNQIAGARFAGPVSALGAETGMLGRGVGALGRAGGAAGRFALPALALGGLQGAFGPSGSNQGSGFFGTAAHGVVNTAQGALSLFGLAHPVLGTDERVNRGLSRAAQTISQLPGGQTPSDKDVRAARRQLAPELDRAEQAAADASDDKNRFAEAMAYLKALRAQAAAYRDIAKEAAHARTVERNQQSREHATKLLDSFGKAYDIYDQRMGPDKAMDKTLSGVYDKMRSMRRTGAKILGENTLAWAQEQADKNPALQGQVDKLTKHIENSFSKMGDHVRVVNGRILTGSAAQWKSIATSITDPANRALSETSAAFQKLQAVAVGELQMMGYSASEAAAVFKGVRSGKISASDASATTGSGQPRLQSDSNLAKAHGYKGLGDGIGIGGATLEDVTARNAAKGTVPSRGGGGNLMGANAGLGVYEKIGERYGLGVTSGRRPGAITASGNVSLHATGDAIDESGPAGGMLSYAKLLASKYGSGIDELIHTPLGFGIKNGKRVPLSFWGPVINAMHKDHVHVGDRTPPGGGAPGGLGGRGSGALAGPGGKVSLKGLQSALGGVPGAMSTAATAAIAAGLQSKINKGLTGGDMPGMTPGKGGALSFSQVARLAESVGLPGITFAQIAKGESAFNPHAIGHDPGGTLGLGLWQITTKYNDDIIKQFGGRDAMFNAQTNARAAKAIYDRQGIGAWYGTKYMTGTNLHYTGDGTGIGRARVTGSYAPQGAQMAGGRSRGGHVFHVHPQITVHGADRGAIRSEFAKMADDLADQIEAELSSGAEEDSGALMS